MLRDLRGAPHTDPVPREAAGQTRSLGCACAALSFDDLLNQWLLLSPPGPESSSAVISEQRLPRPLPWSGLLQPVPQPQARCDPTVCCEQYLPPPAPWTVAETGVETVKRLLRPQCVLSLPTFSLLPSFSSPPSSVFVLSPFPCSACVLLCGCWSSSLLLTLTKGLDPGCGESQLPPQRGPHPALGWAKG